MHTELTSIIEILQVRQSMEVGQIGETGVHVIVITALEQELGTELDLVPAHHHLAMERKTVI